MSLKELNFSLYPKDMSHQQMEAFVVEPPGKRSSPPHRGRRGYVACSGQEDVNRSHGCHIWAEVLWDTLSAIIVPCHPQLENGISQIEAVPSARTPEGKDCVKPACGYCGRLLYTTEMAGRSLTQDNLTKANWWYSINVHWILSTRGQVMRSQNWELIVNEAMARKMNVSAGPWSLARI